MIVCQSVRKFFWVGEVYVKRHYFMRFIDEMQNRNNLEVILYCAKTCILGRKLMIMKEKLILSFKK